MDLHENNWKVIIQEHGRSGVIRYVEHQNEISFDYELSGGGSVVIVWGTEAPKWNETYPWAVDRCRQIYERVAEGAILQKAPNCKYALNLNTGTIDIYEP